MWAVISLVFGLVEILVGLRFVLLLLGASLESGFVTWVYDASHPLVAPFGTVFGHVSQVIPGTIPGSYFETASLVALVIYGLVGGLLVRIMTPNSRV